MPKVTQRVSKLDEALRLFAKGWWIVPQAGKKAVVLGWERLRLSEDDLKAELSDPRLNIAVELGHSGLVDVECDGADAERELEALVGLAGLPDTPTFKSRRGLHRFFQRPGGLPDRAKIMVGKIECRLGNRGALTTLPPSIHPDDSMIVYRWLPGLSIHQIEPAPLPKVLLDAIVKAGPQQAKVVEVGGEVIPEGVRDDAMYRFGCRLLGNGASVAEVDTALRTINIQRCSPTMIESELLSVIKSVERTRERQAEREMTASTCTSWPELIESWNGAMEWTRPLERAIALMLAVCLSTDQVDDQLFIQIIAEAGSGKTRLCAGLLTSKHCEPIDHLTGFFSGWKTEDGKDHSLIARCNHKTLITSEGDTLITSPHYDQIMSQQRRIFDGASTATYKNRDETIVYEGLRTPWIVVGTPMLLAKDQSKLGDRFLKFVLERPLEDKEQAILENCGGSMLRNVKQSVNCNPGSITDARLREAMCKTGGYVDHLRLNAERLIGAIKVDEKKLIRYCVAWARFTASFRARPDSSKFREEKHDCREMPTRLVKQLVRAAICLTAVLQKPEPDEEVLAIVKQVAVDTGGGRTLELCRKLIDGKWYAAGPLANAIGETEDKAKELLRYLVKIGVCERDLRKGAGSWARQRWKLTPKMLEVCKLTLEGKG